MDDHKVLYIYRRVTHGASQSRGFTGRTKQRLPNNRLIMRLDPELVEQGGTQETPAGFDNVYT